MSIKMPTALQETDLPAKKRSNAQKDWNKLEKWAKTLLQKDADDSSHAIGQAAVETEIASILRDRTKNAKGSDCIADWNTFCSAFTTWKAEFCRQNKLGTPVSLLSVIESDLLQRNLTCYQNGDRTQNRVDILVFYFRKLAGRNFLAQTAPSKLYPEEATWTADEWNPIVEQLDAQFFALISPLESALTQPLIEKHQQLRNKYENDVLWWLADACAQNKQYSILLNNIVYCCYSIKQNDSERQDQAKRTLSEAYQRYNPLAGNFVVVYKKNFNRCIQDEIQKKDNDRKENQKEKLRKELQNEYEGEALEQEVEKRLSFMNPISIDTPINGEEMDGTTIGSRIPNTGLSPEKRLEGVQQAYLILQACADTVNSRKRLKTNHDDLFFTEIVSERIRKDADIAKHVLDKQKFYTEACNLDFLNFYLKQSVTNIYDSQWIPLKLIQDFHAEEQKPAYKRVCGFPLESIVYQQFIGAKNESNITGKRDTFRKHMQDCLVKANL